MTEISAVLEQYNQDYRNEWEQTRYICFVTACSMGAKMKKPQDLMQFAWEVKEKVKELRPSQSEIERLREEAQASYNNYIKGNFTEWKPDSVLKD